MNLGGQSKAQKTWILA